MGNRSSTACCVQPFPTGTCPNPPNFQCESDFIEGCNSSDYVCLKRLQTRPNALQSGTCNSTSPCCLQSDSGQPLWYYDDPNNNCGAQATCSTIDFVSECEFANIPTFWCGGEIGGNFSTTRTTTLPIVCEWETNSFKDLSVVQAWYDKYYSINDSDARNAFEQKILPTLCSVPQNNTTANPNVCPAQTADGTPWVGDACSAFVANNAVGAFCRAQVVTVSEANASFINTDMINYCNGLTALSASNPAYRNGEINECLCINRGKDPTGPYNTALSDLTKSGTLNENQLGSPFCWYGPCNSQSATQLTPLKTTQTQPVSCPDICQIINNIKGTIENSKITENINCTNQGPTPPNSGGNNGGGSGSGTNGNSNTLSKYRWWVIGGIAIVAFIVIIVIIFIVIEAERKKEE